jgi:hypothetical protein
MKTFKLISSFAITLLFCLELGTRCFGLPPSRPSQPFSLEDFKAQFPQNASGHFLLEIPMIVNTAADCEVRAVVAGCAVETCGQITSAGVCNPDGRRLRVIRSQIHCCAAHAREYSVTLLFEGKPPNFSELAWVHLAGTLSYEEQGDNRVAIILVKEIGEVPKPENSLLK